IVTHFATAGVELLILVTALRVWRLGNAAPDVDALFALEGSTPAATRPEPSPEVRRSGSSAITTRNAWVIGGVALVLAIALVADQLLGALLGEGPVLLDDVPGVGKTTLARSVARSLDLSFRRIQCPPDLVPSDITGVSIYDQRAEAFEYRPGPLAANVVLVDEINRATPR